MRFGLLVISMLGFSTTILAVPPSNDDFELPMKMQGYAGTLSATNVEATLLLDTTTCYRDFSEPNQYASRPAEASVWFQWTAPDWGQATIETTGSSIDTLLAIFTGTHMYQCISDFPYYRYALTPIVDNDDTDLTTTTSRVTFAAVSGTSYRIVVAGFSGMEGAIKLHWNLDTTAPPPFTLTAPEIKPGLAVRVASSPTLPDGRPILFEYHWTSTEGEFVTHGPHNSTTDLLAESELVDPGELWTVTVTPVVGSTRGPSSSTQLRRVDQSSVPSEWMFYD